MTYLFQDGQCLSISKAMIPQPRTFTGSSDINYIGLVSSSGNAAIYEQVAQAAASARKREQLVIIGNCTTLGLLVLAVLGVSTFLWKRRLQKRKQQEVALALHPFVELEKKRDQVLSSTQTLTHHV